MRKRSATAFAPGRIEVLGNHTDYNEGIVLSCALPVGITVHAEELPGEVWEFRSKTEEQLFSWETGKEIRPYPHAWANYAAGVIKHLRSDAAVDVPAARFTIQSNLPSGAGLSSSAALEVSTALAALALAGKSLSPMEIAKLCRRVENEFVGMPCGLLDQASSVGGAADHFVELDCRSETFVQVPAPEGFGFVVMPSGVKHALVEGAYMERRDQCFEAAKRMGVAALRDTTSAAVAAAGLPDVVMRRALHVTGENERVARASHALRQGDMAQVGGLMFDSHESSRVQFENSIPELDLLVALAKQTPGALGARLSGGGFGGSVVILAHCASSDHVAKGISEAYFQQSGIRSVGIFYAPSAGACILDVGSY